MLTRFARGRPAATGTVIAITVAATLLGAVPASAAGPGCAGTGCVVAHSTGTIPGRVTGPAPTTTTGGKRGGKAPPPCPPTIACGAITLGNAPAPPPRVPTIDVAYDARNQLQLPAPSVHTSPGQRTYVRLRTGLWVNRADFATVRAPATVPGQTVTAIARPRNVAWNMGERTITCGSAGDPAGQSCGYTYARSSAAQPGRAYPISATVTWEVSWTCTGACDAPAGTYPDPTMSMTTPATLQVGEIQTESRPG